MTISQKVAINFTRKKFCPKNLPKLKIMAWNLATWATFPSVLLHKSLKFSKFHQELTQELKTKPGTKPGTKKSQELTQELKPKSATKSSSSGTKLRTLLGVNVLKNCGKLFNSRFLKTSFL